MEQFLRLVISELIGRPTEEIVVQPTREGTKTIFHIALPKSEVGKIIGRGGHTIQALRSLVSAAAAKHGERASVEILE